MAKETKIPNPNDKVNTSESTGTTESADLTKEEVQIALTQVVGEDEILIMGATNLTQCLEDAKDKKYKMILILNTTNQSILTQFFIRVRANLKTLMSQSFASGIYLVDDFNQVTDAIKMMNRYYLSEQFKLTTHELVELIKTSESIAVIRNTGHTKGESALTALSHLRDVVYHARIAGFDLSLLTLKFIQDSLAKRKSESETQEPSK